MKLLYKLLTSRFGILIPLTGICLFLLLFFVESSMNQLARQLAKQMETATDEDVAEIADKISNLGYSGISELAGGLKSSRRVIVFSCRDALENKFRDWSVESPQNSAPHNLLLSKILAANVDSYGPTTKTIAVSFARRILQNMVSATEKYPHHAEIASNCETILRKTEAERSAAQNPRNLDGMQLVAVGGEPRRVFLPDPNDLETMIAANLKTQRNTGEGSVIRQQNDYSNDFDPYSSNRAELLYAINQSRIESLKQNSQTKPTVLSPESIHEGFPSDIIPKAMLATSNAEETLEFNRSEPEPRIASEYTENDPDRLEQLPPFQATDIVVGESETNVVPIDRTPLGQIPVDEIPDLPTDDLIRLLQHPNPSISAIAEQRLRKRDHFQDSHIALAYRLHNPNPEERKQIFQLLPRTPSIQPIPWLMVLIKDPDPEIRFLTVSFIATSKDAKLVRDVMERAKRDNDSDLNALVEKLEKLR